jgi:hypothetical protein
MNITHARKVLGRMVKFAPEGHPLHGLPVTAIRQGASGWNGDRIWPLFEALGKLLGRDRKGIVEYLTYKDGEDALDYCSSFDFQPWVTGALQNGERGRGYPVEAPAPAPAPADDKAATLAAILTATLSEGDAKTGDQIAKLQADLTKLAEAMAGDMASVEAKAIEAAEAAAKAGGATLAPAALKAAVSEAITALAPSPEVVENAAEGARELPPLKSVDDLFKEPSDWFDSFCGWLAAGVNMVMGGSSGAGKTYPAKQACNKLGLPWKLISGNDVLQADELLFTAGIKGGTSYYSDGPLTHAMRHGYVLIVDEGDLLSQATSMIFNDALESREITIPPTGEVVTAAAGFVVVFTSNSIGDDQGHYNREGFDASLKQRLLSVIASPLPQAEEVEILLKLKHPDTGDRLSRDEATLLAKWASVSRPLHFGLNGHESVLEEPCSTRVLVNAGCLWLGYSRETGMTHPGLKETHRDVRESLYNTYANRAGEEGRAALRAADLWIFSS